jgi:uncharacterized protein YgiM (DUF1202 family)
MTAMPKTMLFTALAIVAIATVSLQAAPESAPEAPVAARVSASELKLITQLREMAQPPDEQSLIIAATYAPRQVTPEAPAPAAAPQPKTETLVVTAEALNLREAPSTDAGVLGRLMQGQEVVVASREGGWIEVSSNGTSGWAYGEFLAAPVPN